MKMYLCKITGITAQGKVAATSLQSDDTFAGADILQGGYMIQKPRVGDTCVIIREGNRDICFGIVVDPALLAGVDPGDLYIPTGHDMVSDDDQLFNGDSTSLLHSP